MVKGLGVPSESVQDTPRHQIIGTKEIYYHGGMGVGMGGGWEQSCLWIGKRPDSKKQQVVLQGWIF